MADPRTINIPGNGDNTQQYELAPGLLQYVQAVYVEIDNGAGGDARPLLTLSEQSGVVIAKKRQGEQIDAGDTGSATWALRLTDEIHSFGAATAEFVVSPAVESLTASTTVNLSWSHASGATLLDYSTPQVPRFLHGGIYAVTMYVKATGPTPTTLSWTCSLTVGTDSPVGAIPLATNVWGTNANPANAFTPLSATQGVPAGDLVLVVAANPAGATRDYSFAGVVQRIA